MAALSACSGGPKISSGALPKPAQSKAAAARPSPSIALPRNLPPASMFVGPGSLRAAPSRYCVNGQCSDLARPRPAALEGPAGSPVMFSLSAAPVGARLEIGAGGASSPTVVGLNPGTAMVWQASMPPGTYPLSLVATYRESEVTWQFSLRVAPGTGKSR